jgi:hypothetical protein
LSWRKTGRGVPTRTKRKRKEAASICRHDFDLIRVGDAPATA